MQIVSGIFLPDDDTHFADQLRISPLIDGKATYQLRKYLKARDFVAAFGLTVDVGAHVGLWSRVMAMDFRRVVAFEPVGTHRECFVENMHGHGNVELLPFAVSDRATTLRITQPSGNTGNAHVSAASGDGAGSPRDEVTTAIVLDHYALPARVDLLKIDVEGFETKVILGAEALIKRDRPVVIVEQKPAMAERYGFKQYDARNLLKGWGAKEVAAMNGDYIMRF
jgi:FkbM family methyltransferase